MYKPVKLSQMDLGPVVTLAANSGSRTFGGNTVIAWDPSTTEAAVKVTVSFNGTVIAVKNLSPTDNQMTYHGVLGPEWTKGQLLATFSGDGKSGQLNGTLEWYTFGTNGNYSGFIGAW